MERPQFSVSWSSYKSSVCSGFSALQQNGELVDMTLAADGHFVKVHQVLIALASPYLKDLIVSAPCQHPVIFLNNVSHKVLILLLEYIYTGEAQIPFEILDLFLETAKSLHITGIDSLKNEAFSSEPSKKSQPETGHEVPLTNLTNNQNDAVAKVVEKKRFPRRPSKELNQMDTPDNDGMDTMDHDDSVDDNDGKDCPEKAYNILDPADKNKPCKVQYSVSCRGSLQLILNRFVYTVQYDKKSTGLRRWRCVDGPRFSCRAAVDTKGAYVVNRLRFHNHPYHDKRIIKKVKNNAIFAAEEELENVQKVKCI